MKHATSETQVRKGHHPRFTCCNPPHVHPYQATDGRKEGRVWPTGTQAVVSRFLACLFLAVLAHTNVRCEILERFGGSVNLERNGAIYGDSQGVVFKLNENRARGTAFLNMIPPGFVEFTGDNFFHDPALDWGPTLAAGRDGSVYAAIRYQSGDCLAPGTWCGPETVKGAVVKLHNDVSGYAVLAGLGTNGVDGLCPTTLLEGSDGWLYGAAFPYSNTWAGAVFKLAKDGSAYRLLHRFGTNEPVQGSYPARLLEGSDGMLYGATDLSIFRLNKDGNGVRALYSEESVHSLIEGSDGSLYFANSHAVLGLNKDGSGPVVVHDFSSTNGEPGLLSYPASLVEAKDGALYGVTWTGAAVFRMNKDGSDFKVLLQGMGGNHGSANPKSALIIGSDGALYGSTTTMRCICEGSQPVIYRLWPAGTPDLFDYSVSVDALSMSIVGTPGDAHQLLFSSNLITWITLATFTMPATGIYTYTGVLSSTVSGFFRAARTP